MATPTDWRECAAELRQIALKTQEPARRAKLLSLAERLDDVAAATEAGYRASPFSA
jgi:hypothetical protein